MSNPCLAYSKMEPYLFNFYVSPLAGVILNKVYASLIGIKSSAFFMIQLSLMMEVKMTISIIWMIGIVAGTTLLGRSGDMFPKL